MGMAAPPQRRPTSQAGAAGGGPMMGGIEIPQSTGGIEETLDQWNRNPLLCWLCDELYEEPRILSCYHDFCSRCLTPRAVDGKIFCPLCGKVTSLKEGHLPPRDNLMTFLVESSCEERPPCANCDKSNQGMFFCNTCGQALCAHCREETHRARMFSLHDIIHMSKRGREVNKKCAIHCEPYIMFSTTKRTMLCINCFRESSVDARLHCIDLDSAYGQGCKKLDRAVMLPGETLLDIDTAYQQARQKLDRAAASIRELQNSVRDGVILFKALLDELRKNTDAERHSINTLVDNLQETIRRAQDHLLREVDGQNETKDKLFRSQLSSLGALLPIIQVHLLMCTTFSSSASKYEFLDLVFQLMERLAAIAHLSHPLRPGQSSQIRTNYKSEFSRALEPLLSVSCKRRGESTTTVLSGSSVCSEKPGAHASTESCSRPTSAASVMALGMPYSRRSLSAAKLKIIESGGPFADHCKGHEGKFRELSVKFTRLKEEAQELHRDVTLRRCLTRRGRVEEIVRECAGLEDEFRSYGDEMEDLRSVFDSAWDEQIQRIYAEQEIFQTQVNDVASLRDENKRLMIIAQQLEPYIRSITALMERISPKLQVPQSQSLAQQSGIDGQENANVSVVMQQILEQITACKQEQSRAELRGCADGSSRVPGHLDDSGMHPGIPKPPDPPHARRTPDHEEDLDNGHQSHGFSPRLVSARHEGTSSSRGDPRGVLSPSFSLASTMGGSMMMMGERGSRTRGRTKRQNSEGDSLVWKEMDVPRVLQRRGSEGSEVDARKMGVLAQLLEKVQRRPKDHRKSSAREYESDVEEGRSSSRERVLRARHKGAVDKSEAAERFIDRAAATFDASAVPERPKSACESTLLRAAEKLYNAAAAARPSSHQERRSVERLPDCRGARSRDSSGGRTRSAERERERDREGGIRVPKSVPPPRIPAGGRGELSRAEVRAIVHADATGLRQFRHDIPVFSATMPHKGLGRKENIYENVPFSHESHTMHRDVRQRPAFRKQSSLDAIPSEAKGRTGHRKSEALVASAFAAAASAGGGESRRGTPLRKADSFEGHEEAVKTLVAAVQENRILRRKTTK